MIKRCFFHPLLLCFLCLYISSACIGQVNRPVSWSKTYGGTLRDYPSSLKSTTDGGTIFCGTTSSNDFDINGGLHGTARDIWVVKLDKTGVIEWQKTYLTTADEEAKDLIITSDGGYAIACLANNGSAIQTLVLKINNTGTLQWQYQFTSAVARVYSIAETTDGGFALTGTMNGAADGEFTGQPYRGAPTDLFVAKLNSTGTFLWGRTYGGMQGEFGNTISQLGDGNLLVGGQTYSSDGDVTGHHNLPVHNGDMWLLKLAPNGDMIWAKCYGSWTRGEILEDAFEKDNRYYLVGVTYGSTTTPSGDVSGIIGAQDIWYVVTDTAGNLVRQKCIGGTANDGASAIASTLDDQIIISGNSNSNDVYVSGNRGGYDAALIKIDTLGNKMWGRLFGSSSDESTTQMAARVAVNADTSFSLMAGALSSGGDVPARYGEMDVWLLNFKDTSLYQDLYTRINSSANVFHGRPINYSITFGKNNMAVSADTVVLQFVQDSSLQLVSVSRPPTIVSGDTITWKIPKAAVLRSDTIRLIFQLDPSVITPPDSIRARSFIIPYSTEYFQTNNQVYTASKLKSQNAGIINPEIDMYAFPATTVRLGKPVSYGINYSFQNQLDTLTGTVRLVKDHKMQLVKATPLYNSTVGDTLIWNFSVNPGAFFLSIELQLRADTPYVQLGDSIRNFVTMQFHTQDVSAVTRADSVKQVVNLICAPVSNINATLPFPQGVQWLRVVGGLSADEGVDIVAMSDSTFINIVQTSSSYQEATPVQLYENSLVTKHQTNGTIAWQKLLGGNGTDRLTSMVKAADQSVIVAGHTGSTNDIFSGTHVGFGPDVWLSKLDSNGNIVWNKTLGGTEWDGRRTYIRKFRDNRYVVLSHTQSRNGNVVNPFPYVAGKEYPWLFMIDESGTIIWQKVYSDTLFHTVSDLQVTPDNGILISGFANTPSFSSARVVKTDSLGNRTLLKNFGKPGRSTLIYSITVNADSTILLAGVSMYGSATDFNCYGDHPEEEVWMIKTDKTLNTQWDKYFGGDGNESAYHIIKAAGGGYLVCGSASSVNGNVTGNHDITGNTADAWLLKIDNNGQLEWQKTIGGDKDDRANRMIQLSNSEIILTGTSSSYNNGDVYGSRSASDAIVFKIGAANSITGIVYADNNGNHVKEGNEPFVTSGVVTSIKGSLTNSSDIVNGIFATKVDTGSYVSQPLVSNPYYRPFPAAGTSIFTTYANIDTVNFAMVPVAAVKDLRITVLPTTPARPGFDAQYQVKYENIGTTIISGGNVTFIKDHRADFVSSTVPYTSLVADTIKWDFSNFAPFETREFYLTFKLAVPPTLENGDTLHMQGIINPLVGDSTIIDNVSRLNQLVTGSFDPNDKIETHGPGFPSQLLAKGERLNYIIRFQNTGTDTAFRVLIRDTLDRKLDWESLQMVGASHNYRLTITNGNLLEWKFDPIVLPDSTHNEPASHGFIAFTIKPKADLGAGDTIANRAGIYFDFNLPVTTNTHQNVIDNGIYTCPMGNKVFASGIPGAHSYQWQVNNGNGYVDLVNNGLYNGVNSDSLWIVAPPTSSTGNKYRCIITTADGNVQGIEYQLKVAVTWTGAISSSWEDPGNWDCGVVPDRNTDVLIKGGTIIVNSSTEIRSLTLKPGVTFWVNAGVLFSVLH